MRKLRRRIVSGALSASVALALVASGGLAAVAADQPDEPQATDGVTTEYVADSSAGQQRWLSLPDSRIVLNPFSFGNGGTELQQTADASLPLHVGYFVNDKAPKQQNVLQTYATVGERVTVPTYRTALAESFETVSNWTPKDVTATASNGVANLRIVDGKQWGHIARTIHVDDVAEANILTVDVGQVSAGTTWNVKIAGSGNDDLAGLMEDSADPGVKSFDLTAAYSWPAGPRDITVKIYASNKTGESGGNIDVRSISLHNSAPTPWEAASDKQIVTFDSVDGWARATSAGETAAIRTDGSQGTVTLANSGWGAVEKTFTVDVDKTPMVSIDVADTSAKWALKVQDGSTSDDIKLQDDTTTTGLLTYDLRATTGWSGSKTFKVKLFNVGAKSYTTVNSLVFHAGQSQTWIQTASKFSNKWTPEALYSTGTYPSGTIEAVDTFKDADSFSRTINATTPGAAVGGTLSDAATWDPDSRVITVRSQYHTYAIALPEGSDVRFGPTVSQLFTQPGATVPPASSGAWLASLPAGTSGNAVGVGYAVNDTKVTANASQSAMERALAAAANPAGDKAKWTDFWNAYLLKVPVVQDYSIKRVATGDVTPDDLKHTWFKAWVGLEMNVLPATPETGNSFAILGTGKPSLWLNGTPGTKNAASWDSLLGMQQLVYVDPENAWASFQGMMALVESRPGATIPTEDKYGTLGELGGESLPSRKAQTAWILYSATGDKEKLASTYDKLKLHLNWERYNMRWVLGGNNYFDERDSEFVASLAYDLEFAQKIAQTLGKTADIAEYQSVIDEITAKYAQWFFPTASDSNGKVWDTVQKVYLDSNRDRAPNADPSDGSPYRNENGQWIRPGFSFYTSTAFVMDKLPQDKMVKVMDRFLSDYDANKQLAGMGKFAVKAPDVQLYTYGLLDMKPIPGSTTEQLRDRANVVVNSMLRDTVRAGAFAEVYQQTGNGTPGDSIISRGVKPSLFGISNYIDFMLMANGVRTDEGDPTFVRLEGSQGGVSGMTYMGKKLDVDIDGDQIKFSGPAAADGCPALPANSGQTVTWKDCGDKPAGPVVVRHGGLTRFDTSFEVARQVIVSGGPVFVATGRDFPDALAGGAAAAHMNGALILVGSRVPEATLELIRDSSPSAVYLLGGRGAVSDAVASQLEDATGVSPVRLGGKTRFDTAKEVSDKLFAGAACAFVAYGSDYPDALAASGKAGRDGCPVVLFGSGKASVPDTAEDVFIVGGSGVIPESYKISLVKAGKSVTRLSGVDRFATSQSLQVVGAVDVWVANGFSFPDALSAAAPSGGVGSTMVLARKGCIPLGAKEVIQGATRVHLVGGSGVLDKNVESLTYCSN